MFHAALLATTALLQTPSDGGHPAPDPDDPRPLSVLCITLDTTRPELLGCYGDEGGGTPVLDAIAARSVVYEQARTVAPLTLPAHASMMTGLYPPRHSIRDNSLQALPQEAQTLAELARERGLRTGAFVAAAVLDASYGLDQGFECYTMPRRTLGSNSGFFAERPARAVAEEAIAWLTELGAEEDFFAWVHFFDPHKPYRPSAESLQRTGGDPYRAELFEVDREIGRILEALGDRRSRCLILVVADHGESLGDHGEPTHGSFCFDSTIRVPMLVARPDGVGAGTRSTATVSVVDLHPTVLEAWGLPAGDVDGRSLWSQPPPEDRGVYFESYHGYLNYGWSPLCGWVQRGKKYLHSSAPHVYDLAEDPEELDDRISSEPEFASAARDALGRLASREALASSAPVDARMLEQLRALGYATAGMSSDDLPEPGAASERPAPRRRVQELRHTVRAMRLGSGGQIERAVEVFQGIARRNPDHLGARSFLSGYLLALRRYDEARAVIEELHARGHERSTTHGNLGLCLIRTGELEAAVPHFLRAVELDPSDPTFLMHLRTVYRELGMEEEEEEIRQRLEAFSDEDE